MYGARIPERGPNAGPPTLQATRSWSGEYSVGAPLVEAPTGNSLTRSPYNMSSDTYGAPGSTRNLPALPAPEGGAPYLVPADPATTSDIPAAMAGGLAAAGMLPGPVGAMARAGAAAANLAASMMRGPRAVVLPPQYGLCWSSDCQNGTVILRQDAAVGCLAVSFMCLGGQGSQGPNTPQYSLGGAGVFSVFKVSWVDIGPNGSGGRNYRETNMAQYVYQTGSPTQSPRFMAPPGVARNPGPGADPAEAPNGRPGTGPDGRSGPGPMGDPGGSPHGLPRGAPAVQGDPYGEIANSGSAAELPFWVPEARPLSNPGLAPGIPGRPDLLPVHNRAAVPFVLPYAQRGTLLDPSTDYRAVGDRVPDGMVLAPSPSPAGTILDPETGEYHKPDVRIPAQPDPRIDPLTDPGGPGWRAIERGTNPRNMRPPQKVKELKTKGLRVLYEVIKQVTETDEELECAWKALPRNERSKVLGRHLRHQGTPTTYYWNRGWAKRHGYTDAQIDRHNQLWKQSTPVHQLVPTMVRELLAHGQFTAPEMARYLACRSHNTAMNFLVGRSNQLANKGVMNAPGFPGNRSGGAHYGAGPHFRVGVGTGPAL
jgi:hypothetical protein